MNRIRKGDSVMVVAGREKGKQGKVLRVIKGDDGHISRVIIEKLNLVKRHAKPSADNRSGGIVEKEASIHVSNVMPVDPKTDKPTRVRIKEKNGERVRTAKSGEALQ